MRDHDLTTTNNRLEEERKSYPYQLVASYDMGGLELAVGMDSNDGLTSYSSSIGSGTTGNTYTSPNNDNTYGIRATYGMGPLSVTGAFQTRSDTADQYQLFGSYTLGANVFAAAYEYDTIDQKITGANGDTKVSMVTLQAVHNLNDNMYVYVSGRMADADNGGTDENVGTVGATYYF